MPIFNDLNLDKWKESEIWTDSLWIIPERDNTGKHSGFYHGNFIPQIPNQLMRRFTKKGDVVLFTKYSPNEVRVDGKEYLVIKEDDILAVIS